MATETLTPHTSHPTPDTDPWQRILNYMQGRFGSPGDLKSILFVVGLRQLGQLKKKYSKEEKQDLMNLALCHILSRDGYFEVSHLDGEGWPVWKQMKNLEPMNSKEQENFLKSYLIRYFEEEGLIRD